MPADLVQAIAKRVEITAKAKKDTNLQSVIKKMCALDVLYFIENWVWTYDPRLEYKYIPFLLFPKQRDYILWRRERRLLKQHGLFEKSRDSGASWMNCADQLHYWLFEHGYAGAFASRKQELVDQRGNPSSIFEKLRIMLRLLPFWLLPEGFDWNKHDNSMKLINPQNSSTITGEIGDNIGRGGRSSVYDWDEVAFADQPIKAEAALSGNSDVIFYTSTVNGHNFFYKKRSTLAPEQIFRFHWRDDPRKDDEWYQKKCAQFDSVTIASEIDIDYGASVEGIFIPNEHVLSAINFFLPEDSRTIASLDVATSGKCLNVFMLRRGSKIIHIEQWSGLDTTQTGFKVIELCNQYGVSVLNFDADGVGAGVAGTLANAGYLPFIVNALHGAASGSSHWWEGEEKTSKDKFSNARAEWWGVLAWRFKNTYDHTHGIKIHEPEEMISIPNHPTLIQQISQPIRKWATTGKILVESKDDMRKRGLESPDFADALAYSFYPENLGMWGGM